MLDAAASSQAEGLESLPRTAQGWIPITYFDKRYFHEGQDFLVQLTEADALTVRRLHRGFTSAPLVCAAQWLIDEEGAPLKFVGDWRYVSELRHLEPVAFQPFPEPSAWSDLYPLMVATKEGRPFRSILTGHGAAMCNDGALQTEAA